tara:strand:+ start:2640 stop:4214 length:1575 start_codon:yes stop_codon:yes gene_type:complete
MLGIYCRISVDREGEKSIKEQELLGKEFAEANGLIYEIYTDKGISGGGHSSKRPAFTKLLEDIADGKLEALYVWNLDRTAREETTWFNLASLLVDNNVKLYEEGTLLDLTDDTTFFTAGILSSINALYRKTTSKKIKTVLKRNAQEGKIFAIIPYGYTKDANSVMVVDEEDSIIIKLIFKLSVDGLGYAAIANFLNKNEIPTRYNKLGGTYDVDINRNNSLPPKMVTMSKENTKWVSGTIKNILHNKAYIGKRTFSGEEYDCPIIIEKEIYDKVHKQIRDKVKKTGKRSKNNFLLNDIVFCYRCGKRYTGRTINNHKYYRCASLIKKGGSCGNSGVKVDFLEAFVWTRFFIEDELTHLVKNNLNEEKNALKIERSEIDLELKKSELLTLDVKRKKIVNLIIDEIITNQDGKEQLKTLVGSKEGLEQEIINLNENLEELKAANNKKSEIKTDLDIIKNTSYINKKEIIHKYINKIQVETLPKDNKEFKFVFIVWFNLPIAPKTYISMGDKVISSKNVKLDPSSVH